MTDLTFFVPGHPEPAGSKRGFVMPNGNGGQRAVVTDANPKSAKWKMVVASYAAIQGAPCLDGPVSLTLKFGLARPKSHYRTGRFSTILREDAPGYHTTKPDALKLARGVEDALTGLLYVDDAQIVLERLEKVYGEPEGVWIALAALATDPSPSQTAATQCAAQPP